MRWAALLVAVLVFTLLAYGINAVARWNALRVAAKSGSRAELEKRVEGEPAGHRRRQDGKATGFLALRVDRKGDQVFGIAIPDGAFVEVPGQGFERIGESYADGARGLAVGDLELPHGAVPHATSRFRPRSTRRR